MPLAFPTLSKIQLNSVEKYYEKNIVPFLTHESIHFVLIREEGDWVSERFDNMFPENYSSSCLVDCKLERHMLWRKKFGVKKLITCV